MHWLFLLRRFSQCSLVRKRVQGTGGESRGGIQWAYHLICEHGNCYNGNSGVRGLRERVETHVGDEGNNARIIWKFVKIRNGFFSLFYSHNRSVWGNHSILITFEALNSVFPSNFHRNVYSGKRWKHVMNSFVFMRIPWRCWWIRIEGPSWSSRVGSEYRKRRWQCPFVIRWEVHPVPEYPFHSNFFKWR